MFHFSSDRLAGLDNILLRISIPSRLPSAAPNRPAALDPCANTVENLINRKSKSQASRVPLGDRTHTSNIPIDVLPLQEKLESQMLLEIPCCCTPNVSSLLPVEEAAPPRPVKCAALAVDPYRPLPPLPSSSPLKLSPFLDSKSSLTPSLADSRIQRSAASAPTALLFRVGATPVSPRKRKARKTKEVYAGPQWIPAFHHPNSPYVPWTLPVRQRIIAPPSPVLPSPHSPARCSRSGAVAPEPWASNMFSDAPKLSRKEKIASSWKSLKKSLKCGANKVVACLKKPAKSFKVSNRTRPDPCPSALAPTLDPCPSALAPTPEPERPTPAPHYSPSPDSLASFSTSGSVALDAWLAERCTSPVGSVQDKSRGMCVEEYELVGSWLDVGRGDDEWACGHRGCELHLPDGSLNEMCWHMQVFRAKMPFDGLDVFRTTGQPIAPELRGSAGPHAEPVRFHSLPRLPSQSFDMAVPSTAVQVKARRCVSSKLSRELGMPGGWTFC